MGSLPLNDLGTATYNGSQGGLYPGGDNTRPSQHEIAGVQLSLTVGPLDINGQPSASGKYVLLSIGMSNTTQEFSTFKPIADGDPRKNPNLVIVDGAQGGQDANAWNNPTSNTWSVVATRLSQAGVTPLQVQTIWLKEQFGGDQLPVFPTDAARLRDVLRGIVLIAKTKYPNLRVLYVSSRIYGNYNGPLRGKGAYENGFAVKWLVEDQINGDPRLAYTGANPPAPWIAWGPYMWADGLMPRSDGLTWMCSDFVDDGIHPSPTGRQKVAQMLLEFFRSDSTARLWFLNTNRAAMDFDGDGKTDLGIFRPSVAEWWINRSSTGQTFALQFGAATDRIAPADYTGDGKADVAFFRPSSGEWYVLRSEDFSFFAFPFGMNGDVPVPAGYDADGKADFAVFRPSSSTWFISQSSGAPTRIFQFGVTGDQPVVSDYDGDGKADVGIFRPAPSGAEWWIQRSTAGLLAMQFGASTDKAVQGDYTGDGKTDVAIWRPSSGEWFIVRSEDLSFYGFPFGTNGDVIAPGDYDGDGKFDPTVFRPSSAMWFIARSTAGTKIVQFGANGDQPIPNAYVP